jgi:hypothetical protein
MLLPGGHLTETWPPLGCWAEAASEANARTGFDTNDTAEDGFTNLLKLQLQLGDLGYYVINTRLGETRRVVVDPGRPPGKKLVASAEGRAAGTTTHEVGLIITRADERDVDAHVDIWFVVTLAS